MRGEGTAPSTIGRCLRRGLVVALAALTAGSVSAGALRVRDALSPENVRRSLRAETRYIVLHTTEGRETGSLRKLRMRGEAHYFVHRDGRVARIIDRRRIATHAGLSMWAGRKDLDEVSVAIEVSGYHAKEPSAAQYTAVRELLRQLQSLYGVPDDRVLTHSMIAYGARNRFHPGPHRGRKRCGMVFADPEVRRHLGLSAAPSIDPDVAAGRLRIGDASLHRTLYPGPRRVARAAPPRAARRARRVEGAVLAGATISRERTAWKIAGPAHAHASTLYVFPDGTRTRGDEIRDWSDIPSGTRVLLNTLPEVPARDGADHVSETAAARADTVPARTTQLLSPTIEEPELERAADAPPPADGLLLLSEPVGARTLLGDAATASSTVYLFPSGGIHTGAELDAAPAGQRRLRKLPARTRVLVGYVGAGRVSRGSNPRRVAGELWNQPSTYYRVPGGALRTGTELSRGRVPAGTLVFVPRIEP